MDSLIIFIINIYYRFNFFEIITNGNNIILDFYLFYHSTLLSIISWYRKERELYNIHFPIIIIIGGGTIFALDLLRNQTWKSALPTIFKRSCPKNYDQTLYLYYTN